ncbi:flagellar biosynthesis protein FlhG [Paucidesulfovibrio gracilis DSM 16080]|uniref:Flagellar biosynthesis protein FlhG n=1 Tax=Paucidesulfovibrio gracilis DSM 16080 TaxID=1121449 RepID=A0A1T4XDE1_9BACT|nr:MinD/ParA family protein [Paucidesulfovibrio gracilis]SKA87021.1 flagellar biosynthesis protein FlhG [Paucidesulfovibrio gracilis DSM 16080]
MSDHLPLVFSVTSGKGGVGKTNLSVNMACTLADQGKNVVLLDADLGLANVDVVLGLAPKYNLFHLFHEGASLDKILMETPYGFRILPAASGVSDMVTLSTGQKLELLEAMDVLEDDLDYLIVDTGAGINDNVLYFNIAAQERLLVLTPEPTSLTDAYALIKVLKVHHGVERFRVLINMVRDERAAKEVYLKLSNACDHFLSGVSLDLVGFVPMDPAVRKAVVEQRPFIQSAPNGPAGVALRKAVQRINKWKAASNVDGNIKFFWKKLLFQERSVA